MEQDEILKIFKEKRALLEGHFELASGKHSANYLQCARILQYPDLAEKLCKILVDRLQKKKIDLVVGPAIGGIIIAYQIAKILGVKAIYAERKDERLELRRGFEIQPGEKILLVEDVVTTGGSIVELAELCKNLQGEVMAFGSLVDRTGGAATLPFPLISLVKADFPTHGRHECPLCQKGIPVVKPGSQKIKSR